MQKFWSKKEKPSPRGKDFLLSFISLMKKSIRNIFQGPGEGSLPDRLFCQYRVSREQFPIQPECHLPDLISPSYRSFDRRRHFYLTGHIFPVRKKHAGFFLFFGDIEKTVQIYLLSADRISRESIFDLDQRNLGVFPPAAVFIIFFAVIKKCCGILPFVSLVVRPAASQKGNNESPAVFFLCTDITVARVSCVSGFS